MRRRPWGLLASYGILTDQAGRGGGHGRLALKLVQYALDMAPERCILTCDGCLSPNPDALGTDLKALRGTGHDVGLIRCLIYVRRQVLEPLRCLVIGLEPAEALLSADLPGELGERHADQTVRLVLLLLRPAARLELLRVIDALLGCQTAAAALGFAAAYAMRHAAPGGQDTDEAVAVGHLVCV